MSDFVDEPLRMTTDDGALVEVLPEGKFWATRGDECVVIYQDEDCVHLEDRGLASYFRRRISERESQ